MLSVGLLGLWQLLRGHDALMLPNGYRFALHGTLKHADQVTTKAPDTPIKQNVVLYEPSTGTKPHTTWPIMGNGCSAVIGSAAFQLQPHCSGAHS